MSLLCLKPCDLLWLLCAYLMGFLREGAFGPRLWGKKKRGGQVHCPFLKPPPHSTPVGCEDASEGSEGSGGQ